MRHVASRYYPRGQSAQARIPCRSRIKTRRFGLVKTLTVLLAVAAGVTATISVGSGVAAAAPDVVGQTYADAKATIQATGSQPVIATRIGGRADEDKCIVTKAWVRTSVTQVYEKPKYDAVML